MTQHQTLNRGDVVPAAWLDQLQEYISTMAGGLRITLANAQTVQIVAGSDNAQVAVGISGRWRYIRATVSAGIGGSAPGTYDLYLTAADNAFSSGPGGEVDNTDYSFHLASRPHGSPPPIQAGVVDIFHKIGEADFNGTNITALRQLTGAYDTTLPVTPTAPPGVFTLTPERVIAPAGQIAPVQTWEVGGAVVAYMTPDGRLVTTGQGIWVAGDLKHSLVAADHGHRPDGSYEWLLVSPGRRLSRAQYGELWANLGSPALDGSGTFALPAINDRALVAAGAAHPLNSSWGHDTVALTAMGLPHHSHHLDFNSGFQAQGHEHSTHIAINKPTQAADASASLMASQAAGLQIYSKQVGAGSSNEWAPVTQGHAWGGDHGNHSHGFAYQADDMSGGENDGAGNLQLHVHRVLGDSDGGKSYETGQVLGTGAAAGLGQAHENTQPSYAVNVFVKS